jgi:hypothetical protein
VEVKAKENLSGHDTKSLRALAEEKKMRRYVCVSLDPRARQLAGVTILPLREFLDRCGTGHTRNEGLWEVTVSPAFFASRRLAGHLGHQLESAGELL